MKAQDFLKIQSHASNDVRDVARAKLYMFSYQTLIRVQSEGMSKGDYERVSVVEKFIGEELKDYMSDPDVFQTEIKKLTTVKNMLERIQNANLVWCHRCGQELFLISEEECIWCSMI